MKHNEKPLCTFAVLREYFKKHHYYPDGGHWDLAGYRHNPDQEIWNKTRWDWDGVDVRWDSSNHQPRFILDICSSRRRTRQDLARCLLKANVNSVMTFGDSNGRRFNNVITDLMNESPDPRTRGSCVDTDGEKMLNAGFTPDKDYFGRGDHGMQDWAPFVDIQDRKCRTCQSVRRRCHVNSGNASRNVKIEHVSQMKIIDDSVIVNKLPWNATTTQEFMLKYVLAGRYPDVLLLFLPFHHHKPDINNGPELMIIRENLRYFKSLVDKHVPSDTKVFFLPSHATSTKDPLLNKINKMNHILYEVLEKDMLVPGTNRYGFIDLFKISMSRHDWNAIKYHMARIWYKTIISMFWEFYCNSATENQW